MSSMPVAVSPESENPDLIAQSRLLAAELKLPFVRCREDGPAYLLLVTPARVELHSNRTRLNPSHFSPIFVDFIGGSSGYRHARNCTIKQPLAKAVGVKPGFRPSLVDATAGLGGDGFVLACLGCQVHLVERSPVLFALLRDGLQRAQQDPGTASIVSENLSLTWGNGISVLTHCISSPYTIYLDPMYPHAQKSALNKKEMRVIRELVGDDDDAIQLLEVARVTATNRVVVKRPKGAEYLASKQPSHSITMKNSRFDVYLTAHL